MKSIKYVIGIIALFLVGLMMIAMAFTEPDFSMASRVFSILCGLLFLVAGLAIVGLFAPSIADERIKRKSKRLRWKERKNIFGFFEKAVSESENERMLEDFRQNLVDFFSAKGVKENSSLQYSSSQLYWNVMALKKKRLDKKDIIMDFASERKDFETVPAVTRKSYFDGKYEVLEYEETLAVQENYVKNDQVVLSKLARQVGHIVVTKAKIEENGKFICPSCGVETTKENLIDGCDYCGTKFRIEDLDNKVSAFRIRDDYELCYEEYKNARSHFSENVFWGQFVIYAIITILMAVFSWNSILADNNENILVNILAVPLTAALMAGMFAFLGVVFFWMFIFPFIQFFQSANFYSKKRLEKIKRYSKLDLEAEAFVRNTDPLFSINSFYSNIYNKLAVIHFADTLGGVNAFFEKDRNDLESRYSNVIDIDMIGAKIKNYQIDEEIQQMTVEAELNLCEENDSKASKRKELINLVLVKDAKCKTQEVCGPAVFKCKGCGASLAIENGKTCQQCGKDMNLKEVDWVIRDYSIR